MTQTENIVNEGVMGNLTTLDPLGRMLQLAGVNAPAETLQEDAASNTIDQLVKSAVNLPQYKGNTEAARLYVIGTLLFKLNHFKLCKLKQKPKLLQHWAQWGQIL